MFAALLSHWLFSFTNILNYLTLKIDKLGDYEAKLIPNNLKYNLVPI